MLSKLSKVSKLSKALKLSKYSKQIIFLYSLKKESIIIPDFSARPNITLCKRNFIVLDKRERESRKIKEIVEKLESGVNCDIRDIRKLSRSFNPRAIKYLSQNLPSLLKNRNEASKYQYSLDFSKDAVEYLIKNPTMIDWRTFSQNSSNIAMDYLINHKPEKIVPRYALYNKNPRLLNYLLNSGRMLDRKPILAFLTAPMSTVKVVNFEKESAKNNAKYRRLAKLY